jgi:signal transduction histidine kinase
MLVTTRQRLAASLVELKLAREAELEARAERARSAERAKIGREIHDAVGHHATLIAVEAAALEVTTAEEGTRKVAGRVRALAKASLAEMRTALGLVGGKSESGSGLAEVPALISNAKQAGMSVDLEAREVPSVLPAVGRAVFRIIQESLTNAAKHAPGTQVKVTIEQAAETLRITVTSGPTPRGWTATDSGGQGLASMAERASIVGGHLKVDHKPTGMFTVRAHLPLESHEKSKVDRTQPTIDGSEAGLDAR